MRIGIVGHAADKFTPETEAKARRVIRDLLGRPGVVLVSGRCPMGGIDVWAEEEAAVLKRLKIIHPPKHHSWSRGFRPRNIAIAEDCTELHNIVVGKYPPTYTGRRFQFCYHCFDQRPPHVKSGGCWTANLVRRLGKQATWHIL